MSINILLKQREVLYIFNNIRITLKSIINEQTWQLLNFVKNCIVKSVTSREFNFLLQFIRGKKTKRSLLCKKYKNFNNYFVAI